MLWALLVVGALPLRIAEVAELDAKTVQTIAGELAHEIEKASDREVSIETAPCGSIEDCGSGIVLRLFAGPKNIHLIANYRDEDGRNYEQSANLPLSREGWTALFAEIARVFFPPRVRAPEPAPEPAPRADPRSREVVIPPPHERAHSPIPWFLAAGSAALGGTAIALALSGDTRAPELDRAGVLTGSQFGAIDRPGSQRTIAAILAAAAGASLLLSVLLATAE